MSKISLDTNKAKKTIEKCDKETKTRKFESELIIKTLYILALIIALYNFVTLFSSKDRVITYLF